MYGFGQDIFAKPTRDVFDGVFGNAEQGLPPGAIFKAMMPGMVDSIGLSISEFYAACPVEHRSIYSADGTAFYAAATIIANIEASPYLNDGGELVGNALKGYAQYSAGAAMSKAYKYFGFSTLPVHPPYSGLVANYRSSSLDLANEALIAAVPDYYLPSRDAVQVTTGDKPFFITNAVDSYPAIQFRESQILNLPAGLSVQGRSLSVFFISRVNHGSVGGEKIYAAIGGGTHWFYKIKNSPNAARLALYSSGDTMSSLPLSNQIQLHGIGCNATKRKYWVNGATSEITTPAENSALSGGTIGGGFLEQYSASMDMFECLIYDHLLSDAEYAGLLTYANSKYSINYAGKTKQVIFQGNSIMSGHSIIGNGTIPNRYAAVASASVKTYNLGQDSITTPQLIAAAATNIDNLFDAALEKNIVVLWEGRNDLATGATKEAAVANLITLCQGRKNAGYQVVIGTILPSGGGISDVDRAYINNAITSSFVSSGYADAIADVASDPVIGQNGQNANATYYADTVHQTSAGAAIAASYFVEAINSLID